MTWDDLNYWRFGEWDVVQERLDDLDKKGQLFCPKRQDLFRALDVCDYSKVKVCIMGQDPYPGRQFATGVAFSIPRSETKFPLTLINILKEYVEDLKYPWPKHGNLERWCAEGVLLWNAYPSCEIEKVGSHYWPEWKLLTQEIVEKLSERSIVFVFLGSKSAEFARYIKPDYANSVLKVGHPSPRGNLFSKTPFTGSRIFSRINVELVNLGLEPVNWRLDEEKITDDEEAGEAPSHVHKTEQDLRLLLS